MNRGPSAALCRDRRHRATAAVAVRTRHNTGAARLAATAESTGARASEPGTWTAEGTWQTNTEAVQEEQATAAAAQQAELAEAIPFYAPQRRARWEPGMDGQLTVSARHSCPQAGPRHSCPARAHTRECGECGLAMAMLQGALYGLCSLQEP